MRTTTGPLGFVTDKKFELVEVMLAIPLLPLLSTRAHTLFIVAVLVGLPSTETSDISNKSSALGVTVV